MDMQLVLIFILALLTLNLIVVGAYVVVVLKDFRQNLRKTGKSPEAGTILRAFQETITGIAGISESNKKETEKEEISSLGGNNK